MSGWHVRVIGVTLAVILAGTPVVSLVCALACSHAGTTHPPLPAAANHSHHAGMAHPNAATPTGMNAAYQPDCCREATALVSSVTVARVDGKPASVLGFSVATGGAMSARRMPEHVDLRGVSPPGRSYRLVQLVPLRI